MGKVGIWLIGAHGGVATTAAVGLAALQRDLSPPTGLITELSDYASVDWTPWSEFVLGGHDIRETTAFGEASSLAQGRPPVLPAELVTACRDFLEAFDREVQPGILRRCGSVVENLASANRVRKCNTAVQMVEEIQRDVESFRDRNNCERVVVVNVASTEPPADVTEWITDDLDRLLKPLHEKDCGLPASSLYAIAAINAGCGYVNFTPSIGSDVPAIKELALQRQTVHAGRDGKTGETWLKSVLAPAFRQRHLEIMSWVGHNIFGNMDGQVLDDPRNKQSKLRSKDHLLAEMLGYSPQSHVSIEYIQSLGDWKTAWDHIHFRGFLQTPMVMQFTWQGCDSILAAPMVLDLCRLVDLALRRGHRGVLSSAACFFKSPMDSSRNEFSEQVALLNRWLLGSAAPGEEAGSGVAR